jgi:hypothetical protein
LVFDAVALVVELERVPGRASAPACSRRLAQRAAQVAVLLAAEDLDAIVRVVLEVPGADVVDVVELVAVVDRELDRRLVAREKFRSSP